MINSASDNNSDTEIGKQESQALIHPEQDTRTSIRRKQNTRSKCTLTIDNIADQLNEETRKNAALSEQIKSLMESQLTTQIPAQEPTLEGTQYTQLAHLMNKTTNLIHENNNI